MTSSTRLRNSGRNIFLSSPVTRSLSVSYGDRRRPRCRQKPSARALDDVARADVARHDDDGVLEVDLAALGVGQTTLLENLQQDVEHVRMRLLDLVEQDDRVRLAANQLGELAALVEADVAGRRADQARDRVLLHVLGHVERDERVLAAEQERRERLGSSVLPTPDGPRKMNEPVGRVGSFRPARARRIALLTAVTASS